jgi:hypothetical protein
MKKIILGLISSILIAFGATNKVQIQATNLYYFDITDPYVPIGTTELNDYQVKIRSIPLINPGDICGGSNELCIVNFWGSQLTAGKRHLDTGGMAIPYYAIISTKN